MFFTTERYQGQWVSTALGLQDFIVKDILPDDFEYQQRLQNSVASSPNVRTAIDHAAEQHLFIYPYLSHTLLQLSQRNPRQDTKKRILKAALMGLADLHDKRILHTYIKPDNIMVDCEESADGSLNVKRVQITDLEDAVLLGPRGNLKGSLSGNDFWRSPESWARGRRMALYVAEEDLNGEEPWRAILRRQLSYFGDLASVDGLLHHLGKNDPYFGRLRDLCCQFGPQNPREPFELWKPVDPDFRDIVAKMTSLDPSRRNATLQVFDTNESPFHPGFTKGPAPWSEILLLPAGVTPSCFDVVSESTATSFKRLEVIIDDKSIFDPSGKKPAARGVMTFRWSSRQDPARKLNLTDEYLTSFHEANDSGGGALQIGLLKKPTETKTVVFDGFQESNIDEGQILGSIFVEDRADGCVSL
ncbi:Serine/threonine-protein kinase MST20 [Colletotrichum shisoi]|uniref:Serine/threonine-protein kinase MST20 n=1 Tax=Colletotrichum shisoi TaxID=2078593 RepID=A0A5Q4BMF4_9PEZI|nr:Serine/threonine-protein kinase MST20 [Colletotrichum shisoi]